MVAGVVVLGLVRGYVTLAVKLVRSLLLFSGFVQISRAAMVKDAGVPETQPTEPVPATTVFGP